MLKSTRSAESRNTLMGNRVDARGERVVTSNAKESSGRRRQTGEESNQNRGTPSTQSAERMETIKDQITTEISRDNLQLTGCKLFGALPGDPESPAESSGQWQTYH